MKRVTPRILQLLATCCLIVSGLLVSSIVRAQGFFRVSPGPLNEGHAAYDNSNGCPKCHEASRGVTNQKCLSCHGTALHPGGLHATFGGKSCLKCHTEHKGRTFSIIDWQTIGGRDAFKHSITDFSLTEHHGQVACPQCHVKRLKTGRVSFFGMSKDCESCHAHAHSFKRPELSEKCDLCHQPGQSLRGQRLRAWQSQHVKFSKLTLDGKHPDQACVDCHKNAQMGERTVPRTCIDCHVPNHPVSDQTKNCLDCHDQNAGFKGTKINHSKFGFPLEGKHASATCATCHLKGAKTGPGRILSPSCAACHVPAHPLVQATANCATCHESGVTFKGAEIDHSQFGFARLGKHAKLVCTRCHEPKVKLEYREGACTNCHTHRDAHQGQFQDKPCSDCHIEGGKRNSPFNHDLDTRFPLIGFHAQDRVRNDCVLCHTARHYRTGTLNCNDCHVDEHDGLLGKDCGKCHSPLSRFDTPHTEGFEHEAFKLEGKHKTLACKSCHEKHEYKLGKHRCFDCHQKDDKHHGKLGQDCAKCHRPEKGAPKFDHDRMTKFQKIGPHKKAACFLCHQTRTAQSAALSVAAWKNVAVTKLDLTFPVRGHRCFECHSDPHAGNFGAECEACHAPGDFKRIAVAARSIRPMDHRGFWIRRHAALLDVDSEFGAVKRTCATCHGAPSCLHCHLSRSPSSHTAIFRVRTHGAVASFDPTPCSVCHQAASCLQCHRRTPPLNHRGAWRTLHGFAAGGFGDSNCFVCHRRADCALCHRTR